MSSKVGSAIARGKPNAASVTARCVRPSTVELMLLGRSGCGRSTSRSRATSSRTASSRSPTRPSATALAALLFVGIAFVAERSLRIARRDLADGRARGAAPLFVNQIGFVYSLKTTSASVIALILAATPIFAALIGLALGTETLPRRFWLGAALSFAGVALVALGPGGELRAISAASCSGS